MFEDEESDEEEILNFLVKVTRNPAGENFYIVKATDATEAIGKVIDRIRKDKFITWSMASISISELIGKGDILFLKRRL